jgi:hypothetical protein
LNEKKYSKKLENIIQKPDELRIKGFDTKVQIYRINSSDEPGSIDLETTLKNMKNGINPIFIKVIQRDGHMAWTSPVYIKK